MVPITIYLSDIWGGGTSTPTVGIHYHNSPVTWEGLQVDDNSPTTHTDDNYIKDIQLST